MSKTIHDLKNQWQMAFIKHREKINLPSELCSVADLEKSGLTFYKANVPGNFELDLMSNGLTEDIFFGLNILKLQEYEDCHIWYFTEFSIENYADQGLVLVFEGLDTYADVYVNGIKIGSADNMLIGHEFSLDGVLKENNELLIHIRPAVIEARKYEYPVTLDTLPYNYESLYVRKAPHMYGWDIMPRLVSAGIWKPVRIEQRAPERIEEIFLYTIGISHETGSANIGAAYKVNVEGSNYRDYEIRILGTCGESSFHETKRLQFLAGKHKFSVKDAKLWWPKGRGIPNLYDVTVELVKDEKVIDKKQLQLGIRTVELKRTSVTDEEGTGEFCFIINGERVFMKGSNWVPADACHSRDRERIPEMLKLADEAGCNMLRCWGGNVYEDDLFYNLCDRYGIMIWQDFAMACAVYPQNAEFLERMRVEAESVVKRLRQHPSIVLWAGDNECDEAYLWGGTRRDPNQNEITRNVLPNAVRNLDINRPYLPSSPYIDSVAYQKGRRYIPENHLWGPRDYYKSGFYRTAICHFASEIGYHGCPHPESIKKFISPEKLWPYQDNDEWLVHATSSRLGKDNVYAYRIDLMAKQIRELFGVIPDNLEEFSLASQISQAEAFKFFIEQFRYKKWRTTGILWWNLIDGWPQFSDAVVDYYYNKKLAYSYIKRSQEPVCVMFKEPENWGIQIVASNDNREALDIEYMIKDVDSGKVVLEGKKNLAGDSVTFLGSIPYTASEKKFYLITWKTPMGEGKNHYLAGTPTFNLKDYVAWAKKAELL